MNTSEDITAEIPDFDFTLGQIEPLDTMPGKRPTVEQRQDHILVDPEFTASLLFSMNSQELSDVHGLKESSLYRIFGDKESALKSLTARATSRVVTFLQFIRFTEPVITLREKLSADVSYGAIAYRRSAYFRNCLDLVLAAPREQVEPLNDWQKLCAHTAVLISDLLGEEIEPTYEIGVAQLLSVRSVEIASKNEADVLLMTEQVLGDPLIIKILAAQAKS